MPTPSVPLTGIRISSSREIPKEQVIQLYELNKWSSAKKPDALYNGLANSHGLITAWHDEVLVGLGNAISDGYLVVYFPHLLVHPDYHKMGIGRMIMDQLLNLYKDFHMKMLTADQDSIHFYEKVGFSKAGNTQPMWIYDGNEH